MYCNRGKLRNDEHLQLSAAYNLLLLANVKAAK